MTDYQIIRAGHPTLRRVAQPVAEPRDPAIAALTEGMAAAMRRAGGVGLAAPQIDVPLRVIIFEIPEHRAAGNEEDRATSLIRLINPAFEPLGLEVATDWEGCLSIPGLRGLTPRWARIRYHGIGLDGARIETIASGFHARVVQHEIDHLDGVLYLDRMDDFASLGFVEESRAAEAAGAAPGAPLFEEELPQ